MRTNVERDRGLRFFFLACVVSVVLALGALEAVTSYRTSEQLAAHGGAPVQTWLAH
jgi:hypothetical protein